MQILVIGSSGFIGQKVFTLLANQNYPIQGISSKEIDLSLPDQDKKLAQYLNPESVVIHLAAHLKRSGDDQQLYDANLQITNNICKALLHQPVSQVLYLSSAGVFGQYLNGEANEESPTIPNSFYERSKLAGEKLLQLSHSSDLCRTLTIIRPTIVYGAGDTSSYTPSGFLRAALKKSEIELWGDGSELRNFIYIDDLTFIIKKLIETPRSITLHACNSRMHSFMQVAQVIKEKLKKEIIIKHKQRTLATFNHPCSSILLQQSVPDLKLTSLEDGINLMLAKMQ